MAWESSFTHPKIHSPISLPHFKNSVTFPSTSLFIRFSVVFVSLPGFAESKCICMVLISQKYMVTYTSFWCVLLWNSILSIPFSLLLYPAQLLRSLLCFPSWKRHSTSLPGFYLPSMPCECHHPKAWTRVFTPCFLPLLLEFCCLLSTP